MKINIPTPCTEDVSNMSPTQRGRFCFKCEKEVIDFRNKSSDEIKETLLQNAGKQVCGTIFQSQMDTINSDVDQLIRTFRIHPSRLRLFAIIVVFGTTLFSCDDDHLVGDIQIIGKELIEDSTKVEPKDSNEHILDEIAPPALDLLDLQVEGEMVLVDEPDVVRGEVVEIPDTNTCEKRIDFDDVTVEGELIELSGDMAILGGMMSYTVDRTDDSEIEKVIVPKMILYPNPAIDYVNMRFEDLKSGNVQYKIVDATGKLMTANSFEWDADNPRATKVDVSTFKSGVYFVTILSGNKKLTEQLVVQ